VRAGQIELEMGGRSGRSGECGRADRPDRRRWL